MDSHKIALARGWEVGKDYPKWGNTEDYLKSIKSGLQEDETPNQAYRRLARTAARLSRELNIENLEDKLYNLFAEGILIPSTPVMTNFGTDKGLPVSCFGSQIGDDMYEIGRKELEVRMLSKGGGGTSSDFSLIRPAGAPIKGGILGYSEGVIPQLHSFDGTILCSKQGDTRRGAFAAYLNIRHKDFPEFLKVRQPIGDVNRQALNIHHGVNIPDEFMHSLENQHEGDINTWMDIIETRVKTGEPYMFFSDNANRNLPDNWRRHGLTIKATNLCTEIMLPSDETHTFVCVLSSLNAAKYELWQEFNAPFLAIIFLDAVNQEFIKKGKKIKGIEDAVRFAEKSRALGLGVLGWHTFLQQKSIPYIGIQANSWTRIIMGELQSESERASQFLADVFGEPEWCEGTGYRNLTKLTIAPNRSSAKTASVSESMSPIDCNAFTDETAKAVIIYRNPLLKDILATLGKDTTEVWKIIESDNGSVKSLEFLDEHTKEVYLTFKEINQLELIKQVSIRQKFVDQGQSVNLSFFGDAPVDFINECHYTAWKLGLKALYYYKSESNQKADGATAKRIYSEECVACEA